jgi:L-seryl-tRNA(Ser) seleniumtransferase
MSTGVKKERPLSQRISSPRDLPALDEFLSDVRIAQALNHVSRMMLTEIARGVFSSARKELAATQENTRKNSVTYGSLITKTLKEASRSSRCSLSSVINCTGVIAHTNLGRAPLSDKNLAQVQEIISGYQTLEFDLESGARGKRGLEVESELCALTGAESSLIVNNCAGALFLLLNTISNRKETILSRGELVQIGGGFRVPDVMRRSGAKLIEVGTTNITTVADYQQAIGKKTALLLKVSRSNFSQHGFTGDASIKELATLGAAEELPLVYDLGSGLVVNPAEVNLAGYPSVIGALRDGADIVCFSGDKLFGSTQAGLIVGRESIIGRLRKSPLYRALRPDKTTLAFLALTLRSYLDDTWRQEIPLWNMALRADSELYQFGREIVSLVTESSGADGSILRLTASVARYGAGSVPDAEISSCAISFKTERSAKSVARIFREQTPPIIGRIEDETFMLDLRTVLAGDKEQLIAAIREVTGHLS